MICIDHLTKRYRTVTAVDDLSFEVGPGRAALEADCFHPGRTAIEHLKTLATAAGISRRRPAEVLDMVDLTGVAHRRVGGYSLGMRQRLALATAPGTALVSGDQRNTASNVELPLPTLIALFCRSRLYRPRQRGRCVSSWV